MRCPLCRQPSVNRAGEDVELVACVGRYPWPKHCRTCWSRCGECHTKKPKWRPTVSRRLNGIREEGNEWNGWELVA
jgi:hypothetical protein